MDYFYIFIRIQVYLGNFSYVLNEIGMAKIIKDRRVGVNEAKGPGGVPGIAGFLQEFTAGRLTRVVFVHKSSRYLEGHFPGTMPVLPDHYYLSFRSYRYDIHPVPGIDRVKSADLFCPGGLGKLRLYPKHLVIFIDFGFEKFPFFNHDG